MGKRKTETKLIENQKARKRVFEKRRTGLLKKAKELSILCDIKMLVIIYDQDKQNPEIWPDNDEEAEQIIDTFKQKRASKKPWDFPSTSKKKTRFGPQFSLSDHRNMINHYSQNELGNLVSVLDAKISAVMNLIETKQGPLTAPKMSGDCQETGFLNKGNGKEIVIHQEPVYTQQYQSSPTGINHNSISYPESDPSFSSSTFPFVPLPFHYVDPSSMQQPPNMNAIPSFHYFNPSLMQQPPPNLNAIPSFHHVDSSLMQPADYMNANSSFHYVPSLMQQPSYDPSIFHIPPFIYYPIMPGCPPQS